MKVGTIIANALLMMMNMKTYQKLSPTSDMVGVMVINHQVLITATVIDVTDN